MQPHEPDDQLSAADNRDLASRPSTRTLRMLVRPRTTHKEFGRDQSRGSEFHVCLGRPNDS